MVVAMRFRTGSSMQPTVTSSAFRPLILRWAVRLSPPFSSPHLFPLSAGDLGRARSNRAPARPQALQRGHAHLSSRCTSSIRLKNLWLILATQTSFGYDRSEHERPRTNDRSTRSECTLSGYCGVASGRPDLAHEGAQSEEGISFEHDELERGVDAYARGFQAVIS
jgi:hypothetical protein